MFDFATTKLLQEKLPTLPKIVIENRLAFDIDDLLASVVPLPRIGVVDDQRTTTALGNRILKAVRDHEGAVHCTLSGLPVADEETVEYVRTQTRHCDTLVAVGSGTVNDICKYASFLDGKPYVVFPTAATMNGYLSANASITINGYKTTCAAHMPHGVFCDMSVIADAPTRLGKAGLGDALARPTAQADWLLSHLVLNTHYDNTPFQLLAPLEDELFDAARGIVLQDIGSIALLMKTLLLSGAGMTIAKGSYPASQGEHLLAHAHEMLAHKATPAIEEIKKHPPLHGEEIGVTTVIMATLQHRLLAGKPKSLESILTFPEQDMLAAYGTSHTGEAKKAFTRKCDTILNRLIPLQAEWERIAEAVHAVMRPVAELQAVLEKAETAFLPVHLGWNDNDLRTTTATARYLRDRFTFLDLA